MCRLSVSLSTHHTLVQNRFELSYVQPWMHTCIHNRRANDFNSQGLASIFWAQANFNVEVDDRLETLLVTLVEKSWEKRGSFSPQGISMMFWALGRLERRPPDQWVDGFMGSAIENASQFCAIQVSNLFWGLAKLGVALRPQWLAPFVSRFCGENSLVSHHVGVFLWALASSNCVSSPEVLGLFNQILNDPVKFADFQEQCDLQTLAQFHQVFLDFEYRDEISENNQKSGTCSTSEVLQMIPRDFRNACRDAFYETTYLVQQSQFQLDLVKYVKSCGVVYETEMLIQDVGYTVDICFPEHKHVIEAHGPSHYAKRMNLPNYQDKLEACGLQDSGDIFVLSGKTKLKQRQLQERGWTVVNVPHWEWHALKGSDSSKSEYIKARLPRELMADA